MGGAERIISIEGNRVRMPESALSHDGFRAWVTSDDFPAAVRATFVEREVLLEMSPEALQSHSQVKAAVTSTLARIADEDDLGVAYADGALLTNTEAAFTTEPDFTFVAWAAFEAGRVHLVQKKTGTADAIEILGTPDLVVEIVSDSSVRKDTQLLRDGYRRAGVPEYWLIDARGDDVQFEILRLEDGAYGSAAGARQASVVLGRAFELRRRRNRIGGWTYRLVVVA